MMVREEGCDGGGCDGGGCDGEGVMREGVMGGCDEGVCDERRSHHSNDCPGAIVPFNVVLLVVKPRIPQ